MTLLNDLQARMTLLDDLNDLSNQLLSEKITEQTAIKTLGSLHEYYTMHEIHLKTNNTGLNMLQLAMDHFLEHLQDCMGDDNTYDEGDEVIAKDLVKQLKDCIHTP